MRKNDFVALVTSTSETGENEPFFISSFEVCIYEHYSLDAMRNQAPNKNYLPELLKRRSKVHEKNM